MWPTIDADWAFSPENTPAPSNPPPDQRGAALRALLTGETYYPRWYPRTADYRQYRRGPVTQVGLAAGAPPFRVLVDWPDSGLFSEAGVDVTGRVKARTKVSMEFGKDKVRPLSPPMAGQGSFTLDNRSKDYSLLNRTSPIAAYTSASDITPVTVGHLVKVQAFNVTSGWVDIGTLVTDDIPQHSDPGMLDVDMPCIGVFSKLRGTPTFNITQDSSNHSTISDPGGVSTALYQNITIDVAIGHLLDAAGWSATKRIIAPSTVTLAWYWEQDADPLQALNTLLNTEGPGAALYEDASGNVVFENKNYRYTTTRSTTSQVTYTDGSQPGIRYQYPFTVNSGVKDVVNAVSIEQQTRSAKASGTVWNGPTPLTLTAGQTIKVTVKTSDPFTAAVTPVSGTDFTVSLGSITAVSLDRTSGQSCTISLTAGASGATVNNIGLRAQTVTVDDQTYVANAVSTASSQARYGTKVYRLQTRKEVDTNTLQGLVDNIATTWQTPQPWVMVTFTTAPDPVSTDATLIARQNEALNRQISDRVSVIEQQSDIAVDGWVDAVRREIASNGLVISANYSILFILGTQPFALDVNHLDGQDTPVHVLWS